jgi:cytochrome c
MKVILRSFAVGFAVGTVLILATNPARATTAGDAAHGAMIYDDYCSACHSLDANRTGPAHRGVYGRKAGLAPGFAYSPGVKKSKIVWNEVTLDKWLTNPQATIKGAQMGFRLSDATKRADVIAYLKREGAARK